MMQSMHMTETRYTNSYQYLDHHKMGTKLQDWYCTQKQQECLDAAHVLKSRHTAGA